MKEYPRYDEDGASDAGCCELREPQAAYGYDPGIAAPMLRLYDPAAAATTAPARSAAPTLRLYEPETEHARDAADDGYGDEWFNQMMKYPKFREEYESSMDKCDAEDAAGFEGYTIEEVFAELKKEYPQLWGFKNG